jgi:lipopolysaccharide transport system permease protein
LWEYRDLALFMLWRDLRAGYRQTAFGPLWMIVTPVVSVIISTIIFSKVAKLPSDGVPYPVFNLAGMIGWNFFCGCQGSATGSLLGYKDLMAKVYFPRLILPLIGILRALVDILIMFVMLLGLMLYYGYTPGWTIVFVPVFFALAALTGLAVGLWTAPWVVHFRDVNNVIGYVLRAWLYLTPIVYGASLIPAKWQTLYRLNPMTHVVEGFRWALLGTPLPRLDLMAGCFVVLALLTVAGAYYFRKAERSIVDIA